MTRNQVERDLAKAQARIGKFIRRDGYQYGTHGYAFDAEIGNKRAFAVYWREKVLELFDRYGILTYRKIGRYVSNRQNDKIFKTFHVFSHNNQDLLMICPQLSSGTGLSFIELSEPAEQYLGDLLR